MKNKLVLLAAIAALLLLAGCGRKSEIVAVQCITVHVYGDSPAKGTLSERFTYMTAERLDTHERRNFVQIYGQPGEKFLMDWNERHYD
jgi:major membrane immunogen (membrane-anchored lipoprotein)